MKFGGVKYGCHVYASGFLPNPTPPIIVQGDVEVDGEAMLTRSVAYTTEGTLIVEPKTILKYTVPIELEGDLTINSDSNIARTYHHYMSSGELLSPPSLSGYSKTPNLKISPIEETYEGYKVYRLEAMYASASSDTNAYAWFNLYNQNDGTLFSFSFYARVIRRPLANIAGASSNGAWVWYGSDATFAAWNDLPLNEWTRVEVFGRFNQNAYGQKLNVIAPRLDIDNSIVDIAFPVFRRADFGGVLLSSNNTLNRTYHHITNFFLNIDPPDIFTNISLNFYPEADLKVGSENIIGSVINEKTNALLIASPNSIYTFEPNLPSGNHLEVWGENILNITRHVLNTNNLVIESDNKIGFSLSQSPEANIEIYSDSVMTRTNIFDTCFDLELSGMSILSILINYEIIANLEITSSNIIAFSSLKHIEGNLIAGGSSIINRSLGEISVGELIVGSLNDYSFTFNAELAGADLIVKPASILNITNIFEIKPEKLLISSELEYSFSFAYTAESELMVGSECIVSFKLHHTAEADLRVGLKTEAFLHKEGDPDGLLLVVSGEVIEVRKYNQHSRYELELSWTNKVNRLLNFGTPYDLVIDSNNEYNASLSFYPEANLTIEGDSSYNVIRNEIIENTVLICSESIYAFSSMNTAKGDLIIDGRSAVKYGNSENSIDDNFTNRTKSKRNLEYKKERKNKWKWKNKWHKSQN